MSGGLKVTRIKARHEAELTLLTDVVKLAQEHVPKLRETKANRAEWRDMESALSTLGKHVRSGGFDPTRTFQHVANFDTEIWTLVLDMFAKHDPVTGEQMDDGLLFKYDETAGCLKLHKPFFFAIVDMFESMGIECDMRGKINIV